MSFRNLAAAGACVALLGASACTTGMSPVQGWSGDHDHIAAQPRAHLYVVNRNSSAMIIYVVRSGLPTRLGRVNGTSEATFELWRAAIGAGVVELIAREFPPGRSYTSGRMDIPMGRRVELRLENTLAMSSFIVK